MVKYTKAQIRKMLPSERTSLWRQITCKELGSDLHYEKSGTERLFRSLMAVMKEKKEV